MIKRRVTLKPLVLLIIALCTLNACSPTIPEETSPEVLYTMNNALRTALVAGTFSPPAAARAYAYSNLAAYTCSTLGKENLSLFSGNVSCNLEATEVDLKRYLPELAIAKSFTMIGTEIVWHDYLLEDALDSIVNHYADLYSQNQIKYSLEVGEKIGNQVLSCTSQDGYNETRQMPLYTFIDEPWAWQATPPKFAESIEPWWHTLTPLVLDSPSIFRAPAPPEFSNETNSIFYEEAKEVYLASAQLMGNDTAIANFWDCNPYLTEKRGHVTYTVRQISPASHWMGIAEIACKQEGYDLEQSTEVFAVLGITLSEAFISCWETKYYYNLIRPITYINRYMDESWTPLLETPSFPEYTSGHSVISSAAAVVLGHLFGENYTYTDDVEVPYGKAPRTFSSFKQASAEAAISRLYGGIHYRSAIDLGIVQGQEVGNYIIEKMYLP